MDFCGHLKLQMMVGALAGGAPGGMANLPLINEPSFE